VKRASYRAAIRWLARDANWTGARTFYYSEGVGVVAHVFGVPRSRVVADVERMIAADDDERAEMDGEQTEMQDD
jgi:hypothetical protein